MFLADQVCPALCGSGSDWLCNSEYRIGLLVSIFFALVSWPPQLAGTAAVCINYTNFAVKWVVIITAVAKGVHTAFFVEAERTYTAWAPAGMVRIACMLMGSYANTGIMPQLAADIDKSQQERAAKLCPSIAVGLQFFVYLALAYSAYFGLGNAIGTDVFASYNELYPDFMTSILQGGLALLVWLSSPLVILPMKAGIRVATGVRPRDECKMCLECSEGDLRPKSTGFCPVARLTFPRLPQASRRPPYGSAWQCIVCEDPKPQMWAARVVAPCTSGRSDLHPRALWGDGPLHSWHRGRALTKLFAKFWREESRSLPERW